jgi:predicted SprT family Zn-dependent metalloprotease
VDDDEFEWNEEENERDSNDSSTSSSSSIPDITNRTKNITISSDKENENDEQQTKASIQKPRKKRTSKKSSSDHKSLKATQQQQQQRRTFRKHREEWTIEYLHKYDRMVFDGRLVTQPQSSTQQDDQRQPLLTVSWSNKLRTTAGLTRLRRKAKNHQQQKHDDSKSLSSSSKIYRTADIELSTKVLDTLDRLKCTLLHEMCHAAQWILDGNAKPMHGPIFKKWARWASKQTGVPISVRHSYEIVYKYAWQCESCHVIIQRHSRSVNIERHRCGTCRSRLREIQPPTSTTSTTSVSKSTFAPSSRRKRVETPYNRFVREQSSSVRQRLLLLSQSIDANHAKSKISQSDVLRECARLWRIQQQN